MSQLIFKSTRDEDKIKQLRAGIFVSLAVAIVMFIITISIYLSEDNWKSVTTMPSLFQFQTHRYAKSEIYEIFPFYLSIAAFISEIVIAIIIRSGAKCVLSVYDGYVEGIAKYGKKIVIPTNQINSVSTSDGLSSISIQTAAATHKFLFIKNNKDIYSTLVAKSRMHPQREHQYGEAVNGVGISPEGVSSSGVTEKSVLQDIESNLPKI